MANMKMIIKLIAFVVLGAAVAAPGIALWAHVVPVINALN